MQLFIHGKCIITRAEKMIRMLGKFGSNLFMILYMFVNLFFKFLSVTNHLYLKVYMFVLLYEVHFDWKMILLQLYFKSSRVSEWLEDEEEEDATVDLYTTTIYNSLTCERDWQTFNIDCKEDRRLREIWNMAKVWTVAEKLFFFSRRSSKNLFIILSIYKRLT